MYYFQIQHFKVFWVGNNSIQQNLFITQQPVLWIRIKSKLHYYLNVLSDLLCLKNMMNKTRKILSDSPQQNVSSFQIDDFFFQIWNLLQQMYFMIKRILCRSKILSLEEFQNLTFYQFRNFFGSILLTFFIPVLKHWGGCWLENMDFSFLLKFCQENLCLIFFFK